MVRTLRASVSLEHRAMIMMTIMVIDDDDDDDDDDKDRMIVEG